MLTPEQYVSSLFSVAGKSVVVTGAADGLGKAISQAFVSAGARVTLADFDGDRLKATTDELLGISPDVMSQRADISSEEQVDALVDSVTRRFGTIDVLVNNAGAMLGTVAPESYPLRMWEATFAVNLTGPFLCARAASRVMISKGHGGSVINMSSIGGITALGGGILAYDVSKSGLNQLTRDLAVEWAKYSIRVNSIAPCQFRTRGWASAMQDPARAANVNAVIAGIPMRRMGEAHEIVGAVLFLASEAASMVTGIVLPVDGGNLATNATLGGVLQGLETEG
jgi:NAD(P)-dependent dehydrogenase (short-subunit alcohol dehydrogenase family)